MSGSWAACASAQRKLRLTHTVVTVQNTCLGYLETGVDFLIHILESLFSNPEPFVCQRCWTGSCNPDAPTGARTNLWNVWNSLFISLVCRKWTRINFFNLKCLIPLCTSLLPAYSLWKLTFNHPSSVTWLLPPHPSPVPLLVVDSHHLNTIKI